MDNNPISGPAPTPNPEPTPTPVPNPTPAPTLSPNIPMGNTTSPFAAQPVSAPSQGNKASGKLIGILAGVVVLAIIVVVVMLFTSNSQSTPTDSNPDSNPDTGTDVEPDGAKTNPDSSSDADAKRHDDYSALLSSVGERRPEVGKIDAESYMGSETDPNGVPYVVEVIEYDHESPAYPTANDDSTEVFVILNAKCSGKGSPIASDADGAYVVYGATEDGGRYCIEND